MNKKLKGATIALLPFSEVPFSKDFIPGTALPVYLPSLGANRLMIHCDGDKIHLKQGAIEKEIVVMAFFQNQYHTDPDKMPVLEFVRDIERKHDPNKIVWVVGHQRDLRQMEVFLKRTYPDVYLHQSDHSADCRYEIWFNASVMG